MSDDKIIDEAYAHLLLLCKSPDKFRMCIPPQKDDSDMIFSRAFDYANSLKQKLKTATEALEYTVKESGTSTNYNLKCRQALKEIKDE